jgi:hypothetical protein
MALNNLKIPIPRSYRVPEWLREPGIQNVRFDLLMVEAFASKQQLDAALDAVDEENIPIIKVTWDPHYQRFIPLQGKGDMILIQALNSMGLEYIKVEVVGDPVLSKKWLTEEETTEQGLPVGED